jgi:hypothetical protein
MKTYRVTATQQAVYETTIEAKSKEQAKEIARRGTDDWVWSMDLKWIDYHAEEEA